MGKYIENNRFIEAYGFLFLLKKVGSKSDFARKLGVNPQAIYDFFSHRIMISRKTLDVLESVYGVSKKYILLGEGEMLINSNNSNINQSIKGNNDIQSVGGCNNNIDNKSEVSYSDNTMYLNKMLEYKDVIIAEEKATIAKLNREIGSLESSIDILKSSIDALKQRIRDVSEHRDITMAMVEALEIPSHYKDQLLVHLKSAERLLVEHL